MVLIYQMPCWPNEGERNLPQPVSRRPRLVFSRPSSDLSCSDLCCDASPFWRPSPCVEAATQALRDGGLRFIQMIRLIRSEFIPSLGLHRAAAMPMAEITWHAEPKPQIFRSSYFRMQ